MKIYKLFIVLILLSITNVYANEKANLIRREIYKVIKDKKATVGVAFLSDNQFFTLNDEQPYPLMSVFKFHVAFATLKKMEAEHTNLDTQLHIVPSQMQKDTYSPLRDRYPDQDFYISLGELIRYNISESDNNACDILIDYTGGIDQVTKQIKALGSTDFNLSETEATMHSDINNSYKNWSRPSSMVKLLHKVYNEKLLDEQYDLFLKQVMIETTTGKDKIKAGLPTDIVLGHKTGNSDRLSDGTKIGDNDAGVIYFPNGQKCYLAIFIKDSQETDSTNAQMIADISKIIYQALYPL